MSAVTNAARQQPLGLVRAEAVVSMFAAAFDRMIDMLRIRVDGSTRDEAASEERRWYGAFY
ncbi:MAG: hypothetical protein OEU89_02010 [Burkholderiaceae bacterium]|jgi:hypothetical protein|nr:hypothetical protein [Burkholderiaceae bacterium]MDH5208514.1 hypothetical protein [Burkholderiaceae bacterium]